MKIAHIYYSLGYGGIETLILNVSNWQVKNGHDVSIILVNENYESDLISLLDERVKIIKLNRKPNTSPMFAVLKLNFTLIKSQFDILHTHAAELGRVILPVFNFSKVLHVHSTVGITNAKVPYYRKCIAISEVVRDVLASKYGVKSKVIYNGIDFHRFKQRKLTAVSSHWMLATRPSFPLAMLWFPSMRVKTLVLHGLRLGACLCLWRRILSPSLTSLMK